MSPSLIYRPEIDGLRAIAVVAVIIFHLNATWLRGGFLGVDVFFVLSGFLITSIIYTGLHEKNFSLVHFWMRRIQRIFPALMVMVAAVAIVGNFVLISPERTDLILQARGRRFFFQYPAVENNRRLLGVQFRQHSPLTHLVSVAGGTVLRLFPGLSADTAQIRAKAAFSPGLCGCRCQYQLEYLRHTRL